MLFFFYKDIFEQGQAKSGYFFILTGIFKF